MKIGILGIPFNGDGTRPEIENPAAAIRTAGLTRLKLHRGFKTVANISGVYAIIFMIAAIQKMRCR